MKKKKYTKDMLKGIKPERLKSFLSGDKWSRCPNCKVLAMVNGKCEFCGNGGKL